MSNSRSSGCTSSVSSATPLKPKTVARCTIINLIDTEKGFRDQLLSKVVNLKRQELEIKQQKQARQQQDFKVKPSMLEKSLLMSLFQANAENILDYTELINNLDDMKKTTLAIENQRERSGSQRRSSTTNERSNKSSRLKTPCFSS